MIQTSKTSAQAYQWLTPQEAVLHRPDAYVGSNDPVQGEGRLLDEALKRHKHEWCLSPIFMKIFDEVLVNALDASMRDEAVRMISVSFNRETGAIVVENDGSGIPIAPFVNKDGSETGRLIPEVIFSELAAGSNFDDTEARLVGGRNGVGVSCCNIWSTSFEVLIDDGRKQFQQSYSANMTGRTEPVVKNRASRKGRVCVSFVPDYLRMGIRLNECSELLERLLRTRTAEASICSRLGLTLVFNGTKLPSKASLFATELFGLEGGDALITEEFGRSGGPGAELTVGPRRGGDDFCGFVNGIRCDGGSLAAHVREKLHKAVSDLVKKRCNAPIRLQTVREFLSVLVVARIANPRFTSQSKEALSTPVRSFGFSLEFGARFLQKLGKSPVLEAIIAKETDRELALSMRKVAPSRRDAVHIDKYDPALDCRRAPLDCTLILTEGDSAKALAVAGLSVVGRERFGVFPLRGVPLNVRNCPLPKALQNKEIANLLKILNISPGSGPENLRYGRVAIMSDQDLDGSHICGLVLNLVATFFPQVLAAKPDFVCRIITPLLKATPKRLGGGSAGPQAFFSTQSFQAWAQTVRLDDYTIKYYKGLGTSTAREAKEIFRELARHTIGFNLDETADSRLAAYFDDGNAQERKRILTEDYSEDLAVDYSQPEVSVSDFLDKDLIHFGRYSNFRGLASAIDGLTPSRRKVLFYFMGLRGQHEIKVAQAAAGVAQKTVYLHGENSLVETIVALAQEHVGTNNCALLLPIGQFGSRLDPPKVHAAGRYIFTKLSNVSRALFPEDDDDVLDYREEEGEQIEPVHYVPVIPLVLLNGASGIGTGFSTNVPCFSFASIVAACRAVMAGAPVPPLEPYFEGFTGTVELTDKGVTTRGVFERTGPRSLLIRELPVGRWTDCFLRDLKEAGDKAKFPCSNIVNLSTDTKVHIELTFAEDISKVDDAALSSALKLSTSIPSTYMYLHDSRYRLRLFAAYEDIVLEHAQERLRLFAVRKERQLEKLARKIDVAEGRARFIDLVIGGQLRLTGKKRLELEEELVSQCGLKRLSPVQGTGEPNLDYVLSMHFASCTEENISKLHAEVETLRAARAALQVKTPEGLWEEALLELEQAYAAYRKARMERQSGDDETSQPGASQRKRKVPSGASSASARKAPLRAGGARTSK